VARFAGIGHLLINEAGSWPGAVAAAGHSPCDWRPRPGAGTVRFALADPVGQGQHLSAFLRLPAPMRVGSGGAGVAVSPEEIEGLLSTLTGYVVEVTQTRLTNVYDSVEAYNAAATGPAIPYTCWCWPASRPASVTGPRSCSAGSPATGPGPASTCSARSIRGSRSPSLRPGGPDPRWARPWASTPTGS